MALFAHVDCNNFYTACEQLFDPTLTNRPVVVLSNNDGCVVARNPGAKALGVKMGVPWYQIQKLAQQQGIVAMSSNYAVYLDMSNRVVQVLSQFTPHLEQYSIDESFLDLSHIAQQAGDNLVQFGQLIRQRIARWLGLPVCVGIATTKTLAKLADHCAKKNLAGQDGVCDFTNMSPKALNELFGSMEVSEVWGVGPQTAAKLEGIKILTVLDLRDADAETLRRKFSVVLARTILELRGISCLELKELAQSRQQIMCSRSFGQAVYDLDDLREAVLCYLARAVERLHAEGSLAGALHVYLRTNPFKEEPQYQRAFVAHLPEPTDDTQELTGMAIRMLERMYRPGFAYKKAGVLLSDLLPKRFQQGSLFSAPGSDEYFEAIMQKLDRISRNWDQETIQPLAAGNREKAWQMRREHLSPAYTTRWEDLPVALAN